MDGVPVIYMQRRTFLQVAAAALGWSSLSQGSLVFLVRRALAGTGRRLLPADTELDALLFENPADLDARNLPVTPIDRFKTMGLSDHKVDLQRWRLTVGGAVASPLRLDYRQIRSFPVVERKVLLICPGVFAYHARWKGLSVEALLQQAGVDPQATHVDVKGPSGPYAKVQRFPRRDVRLRKAFLAYAVNGRMLPQKHGYPLRAVAEGYVGSEWIKYADTVEAVVVENSPPARRPSDNAPPAFVP